MNKGPIIFIGEGRSGTTVIFEIFVLHEEIAFLTNYTEKFFFPQFGLINVISRYGREDQYKEDNFFIKKLPRPSEAYNTWEKLCGKKFRDSFLKDVKPTSNEKNNVNNYIDKIIKYQMKNRFATKLTGPPRITYLYNINHNTYFINIIRDPRPVVASKLNVDFRKNKGLTKPYWKNTFNKHHFELYLKYHKDPVAIASLEWLSIYEQTIKESEKCNKDILNIKYEDFVENPYNTLKKIIVHTDLTYSNIYDNRIKAYISKNNLKNLNHKYKERLSKKQINIIEEICEIPMRKLGYLL